MQRICVTPDVHLFSGLGGNLNPFLQQLSITQFPIVSTIFGYFRLWTRERDPGQAYHRGVRGEEHLAAGLDLKVGPTEKQGQLSRGYDEVMVVWANEHTGREYVWNCCLTDCVVWDWENEPSINKITCIMPELRRHILLSQEQKDFRAKSGSEYPCCGGCAPWLVQSSISVLRDAFHYKISVET